MSAPLMHLDVDDLTSMNGGEPLPAWAVKILDAHNRNVDALSELRGGSRTHRAEVRLVTKTPASDSFDPPLRVACPFQPTMVKVTRVRNLTDINAAQSLTVSVDWILAGTDALLIRAMPGLDDGVAYAITLELTR